MVFAILFFLFIAGMGVAETVYWLHQVNRNY